MFGIKTGAVFGGKKRRKPEAILPVRCTFRIKTGAVFGGKKVGLGIKKRPKPVSDPARQRPSPSAVPPEATQARQVLLWGQEGASWNQEGAALRARQVHV
jgi:hypothetical protein